MSFSIAPYDSMGGTIGEQTITDIVAKDRSPHFKWVDSLRVATDFITPDNTLVCVADRPFFDLVTKVTPVGLVQSVDVNEAGQATLVGEIGSRRKRAVVGSSGGGSINLSRMTTFGNSALRQVYTYAESLGIDTTKKFWSEAEWTAMVGMNHDYVRNPVGFVIVEAGPDGRNYSAYMCEQAVCQGTSKAYQAGSFIVVENLSFIYEQQVPIWGSTSKNIGGGK